MASGGSHISRDYASTSARHKACAFLCFSSVRRGAWRQGRRRQQQRGGNGDSGNGDDGNGGSDDGGGGGADGLASPAHCESKHVSAYTCAPMAPMHTCGQAGAGAPIHSQQSLLVHPLFSIGLALLVHLGRPREEVIHESPTSHWDLHTVQDCGAWRWPP